jgi:septal ring factor EnvC (AmiA/AmiB activator)
MEFEDELRDLQQENQHLQSQLAEVNEEKAYAEARLHQLEQNLRNLTGQGGQQQR